MRIKSLHVRRFRSAERTSLENCGGLNVLVGKNNAGKSNLLACIELTLNHLKSGSIAGSWRTHHPQEEFTDRDATRPIQIGITFELNPDANAELRRQLTADAPNLEKAIAQLAEMESISVIVSAALVPRANVPFLYLSRLGVGEIDASRGDLSISGTALLSVSNDVAVELFQIRRAIADLEEQINAIGEAQSDRSRRVMDLALRERSVTRGYWGSEFRPWPTLTDEVDAILKSAQDTDDLVNGLRQLTSKKNEAIAEMQRRETRGAMAAYAGEVKIQPSYVGWLMKTLGCGMADEDARRPDANSF